MNGRDVSIRYGAGKRGTGGIPIMFTSVGFFGTLQRRKIQSAKGATEWLIVTGRYSKLRSAAYKMAPGNFSISFGTRWFKEETVTGSDSRNSGCGRPNCAFRFKPAINYFYRLAHRKNSSTASRVLEPSSGYRGASRGPPLNKGTHVAEFPAY